MEHSNTIATMKNIFKSLMLVAVAAMGFTACEKENNDVNQTEQKTVITGVAAIGNDDTRSYFTENNGEGYASKWEGNEEITVFAGGQSVPTTIDAEGNFTATFDGVVDAITVCSPANQWSDVDNRTVPAEQTPRANSVDPAAHILKGEAAVVNGSAAVTMKHAVAYGKMTVNTPAEFDIDYVELTLNTYTTYTIFADNVVDNTFWFAASEFTVNQFKLSAYNAKGEVYTKTVSDLPAEGKGSLIFQNGRVSTFAVSDLEMPEEDAGVVLTKATASIAEGVVSYERQCYNIYFTNEAEAEDASETVTIWAQVNTGENRLETFTYTTSNSEYYINNCSWTGVGNLWPLEMDVEVVDGQYSITFTGTDYNNSTPHVATFVGTIEGFVLPSTDPYMELDTNELIFSPAAESKTINVKTKNTTEAINATSDNTHFDVKVNGNVVTVTADENTTSDDITGTITITCGTLTDTVAVKQKGDDAVNAIELTGVNVLYVHDYHTNKKWGDVEYSFSTSDGKDIVFDILMSGLVPGKYGKDKLTANITHRYGDEEIKDITFILSENGDNYEFDVTFSTDNTTYYHFTASYSKSNVTII